MRYRPDQKRIKGKFAYEGKNGLTSTEKSDTINSLEFVKSLIGTGKRYPVRDEDGGHIQLDTNKDIEKTEVFCGKGTKREIRNRRFLESDYHIKAEEWQKCSGFGYVVKNGISVRAELHWYQAMGKRTQLKVKRYFDES